LQPRLQTNIFPQSFEDLGTVPLGYRRANSLGETIVAVPLIVVNGLSSQDGVM